MAGLISREQAWELLTAYNKDAFHLHHALVLEGVMRYLDVYMRQTPMSTAIPPATASRPAPLFLWSSG